MNSFTSLSYFIWFVLLAFTGCSRNIYIKKQIALANKLDIEFSDSQIPINFPLNYYYEVLKPGMSIDEVHKIIISYEEVYRCGDLREVYYYFSNKDDDALRFTIFYKKDTLNFEMIQGEDSNSRYIKVDNCLKGRKLN
jgi:hypothetical protein